jgi:hypothetical protein
MQRYRGRIDLQRCRGADIEVLWCRDAEVQRLRRCAVVQLCRCAVVYRWCIGAEVVQKCSTRAKGRTRAGGQN